MHKGELLLELVVPERQQQTPKCFQDRAIPVGRKGPIWNLCRSCTLQRLLGLVEDLELWFYTEDLGPFQPIQ